MLYLYEEAAALFLLNEKKIIINMNFVEPVHHILYMLTKTGSKIFFHVKKINLAQFFKEKVFFMLKK